MSGMLPPLTINERASLDAFELPTHNTIAGRTFGLDHHQWPEKHNAISLATLEELHSAVDRAAGDERIRVIGVTGQAVELLLRARTLVRSRTET